MVLQNRMPDSIARGVRIEPTNGETEIVSAGYWADLSGEASGTFELSANQNAAHYGSLMEVEWYDEKGNPQHEAVRLISLFEPPSEPYLTVS